MAYHGRETVPDVGPAMTSRRGALMKAIASDQRVVVNIHEAAYAPNVYEDGVALGDSILQLDGSQPLGCGFHIYRMPAGMTTRAHRHNGLEQFLMLEGELIDNDGTVYRQGDLVLLKDGTEHCSHSPGGCLIAVHLSQPETNLE
jgi:quercetin dioxygenase-like cupin family protein